MPAAGGGAVQAANKAQQGAHKHTAPNDYADPSAFRQLMQGLDADNSGGVSFQEMLQAVQRGDVKVHRGHLLERMQLESDLGLAMIRLITFATYTLALMALLMDLAPASSLAAIHSWQRSHLGVDGDALSAIRNRADVYDYIIHVSEQNNLIQPASNNYWCDPRFLDPVGRTADGEEFCVERADAPLCTGIAASPVSAAPASAEAAGAHRRMSAAGRRLSGTPAPSGPKLPYANPTAFGRFNLYDCTDSDVPDWWHKANALATEFKSRGMTREEVALKLGDTVAKIAYTASPSGDGTTPTPAPTGHGPAASPTGSPAPSGHGTPAPSSSPAPSGHGAAPESPTPAASTPSPAHRRMSAKAQDPRVKHVLEAFGAPEKGVRLAKERIDMDALRLLSEADLRELGFRHYQAKNFITFLAKFPTEDETESGEGRRLASGGHGAPAPAPGGGPTPTIPPDLIGPLAWYKEYFPGTYKVDTDKYVRKRKFPFQQVSILPLLVYQSRYGKAECVNGSYAAKYSTQTYNPNAPIFGINAPKNGSLITCVDRDNKETVEYVAEIDTDGYNFDGTKVYARFADMGGGLISGTHVKPDWSRMDWLDVYTADITVSLMIYIPALEAFTSLSVVLEVDDAGAIEGSVQQATFMDINFTGGAESFLSNVAVCAAFGILGCLHTMWVIKTVGINVRDLYELATRVAVVAFSLYPYLSWQAQEPMALEFDQLLTSFLTLPKYDHQGFIHAIAHFFEVKEKMYAQVAWMGAIRAIGFFVIFSLFIQLVLLLDVHPRIGVLGRTLALSVDSMMHFMTLFGVLYFFMAFLGHWMFAPLVADLFGSFGDTLMTMMDLLVGNFDFTVLDNAQGAEYIMFVLWYMTFALLMFFTLLNFFLAIVVDAFVAVKTAMEDQVTEMAFWTDIVDVILTQLRFRRRKMNHNKMRKKLKVEEESLPRGIAERFALALDMEKAKFGVPVDATILATQLGISEADAQFFVAHYACKISELILPANQAECLATFIDGELHPEKAMEALDTPGEAAEDFAWVEELKSEVELALQRGVTEIRRVAERSTQKAQRTLDDYVVASRQCTDASTARADSGSPQVHMSEAQPTLSDGVGTGDQSNVRNPYAK